MTVPIAEYIHQALTQSYPDLRFHIKKGRRGYRPDDVRSLIVEYDREGVIALGGNEASMRKIVHDVLHGAPIHTTVTAVSFEKYVSPKGRERLRREARQAELEGMAFNVLGRIKRMIAADAADSSIVQELLKFQSRGKE